jgi:hypothetical protein
MEWAVSGREQECRGRSLSTNDIPPPNEPRIHREEAKEQRQHDPPYPRGPHD